MVFECQHKRCTYMLNWQAKRTGRNTWWTRVHRYVCIMWQLVVCSTTAQPFFHVVVYYLSGSIVVFPRPTRIRQIILRFSVNCPKIFFILIIDHARCWISRNVLVYEIELLFFKIFF